MRAFWKYDSYPFALSGVITKTKIVDNKKYVETKGFGVGYYFNPFLILNNKQGLKLSKELKKLEAGQREELGKIRRKFQKKLNYLMKDYERCLI